jgi:hypothetical protein
VRLGADAIDRSGKYEQRVCQALLAGMKDLIGQIGFETDVACEAGAINRPMSPG